MSNVEDWKNIEVDVNAEAKANHIYIAYIVNVETSEKNGQGAYKFTYESHNNIGETLKIHRTVLKNHFQNWLSFHNGFDPKNRQPLHKISSSPQLIIVGEYDSYVYVKTVIKMDNLAVKL